MVSSTVRVLMAAVSESIFALNVSLCDNKNTHRKYIGTFAKIMAAIWSRDDTLMTTYDARKII